MKFSILDILSTGLESIMIMVYGSTSPFLLDVHLG